MNRAKQIAILAANQQQSQYMRRSNLQEQRRDRQTQFNAIYQGYEASTGLHRSKGADGSFMYCESITSGGVASGKAVTVHRPASNPYGYMKGMPR